MLLGKDLHSAIEDKHIIDAGLLGALTFVMDDTCLGEIVILVTTLRDAVRQVDVLAVHEKCLIEQPHLVQSFLSHEHEGTGQNLDLVGLIVGKMTHVITGKAFAVREEFGQTEHLVKRRLRRRQTALRFWQELPLTVHHLHTETACIRMAVHEGDTFREGIILHHRVGIEEQHILACRNPNRLVVCLCKTDIVLVGDDLHLGKLLRQHLQRAVNGVVINDKHLPLDALHGAAHRVKALFEEILDVVVDDDDREFHFFSFKLSAVSYQLDSTIPES